MTASPDFFRLVVDSVTEHIAVIDRQGIILFVNRAWLDFSRDNNYRLRKGWSGVNYLYVCDKSGATGEEGGKAAAVGIRMVMDRISTSFYFEYPCHSPVEKRWFMMSVSTFQSLGVPYYVISHKNITERKLAEERVFDVSRIDGLTGVPNRRYFDQFLEAEWKRCARLHFPITLAIMDIDYFKLLNDHYGHQAGDECLVKIGAVLNALGKRPGDLFARYGGEEFALVFGNTTVEQSLIVLNKILDAIADLNIPNEKSPVKPTVTVSIGIAMTHPGRQDNEKDLIRAADRHLYAAKEYGRDRLVFAGDDQA